MITVKFERLKPSTQCPAVSTRVGLISDPPQWRRPFRKIATANGQSDGFAGPPPTIEDRARGAAGEAEGRAQLRSAPAHASSAM
jgi:hypothetical protein